jgi:hypothetical protein
MTINLGWGRSIVAVVGGVFLSFILVVILGAALVRTPEMHLFLSAMREGQSGRDLPPGGASAVLAAMDVTDFRMRWMMGPGIAALVGVFVGLVGKERVWPMGVLAAVPYAFLFSGPWSSGPAVMFAVLYVGIAGFAAWVVCKSMRRLAMFGRKAIGGV